MSNNTATANNKDTKDNTTLTGGKKRKGDDQQQQSDQKKKSMFGKQALDLANSRSLGGSKKSGKTVVHQITLIGDANTEVGVVIINAVGAHNFLVSGNISVTPSSKLPEYTGKDLCAAGE